MLDQPNADEILEVVTRWLREQLTGQQQASTAFQARVWSALREIPSGETRTYAEVAASIGRPTAVRAVARACATNPVALAIPCHRVLRSDGSLAGYRWGITVKESLLVHERA